MTFRSCILCATPRSGSTLLCRMLSETGVAGRPKSYFHRPSMLSWATAVDVAADREDLETFKRVLEAVLERGRGRSDVFGLRLMRESYGSLAGWLEALFPDHPSAAGRFEAAFGAPLYIYLRREDKVAQAVSRAMAEQTGLWHRAADGRELERTAPAAEPVYDADLIASHVAALSDLDEAWARWFHAEGIDPLRLSYEELAAAPGAQLRRILMRLGLDPAAADGVVPSVAKLADEVSAAWVRRFRAERTAAL